MREIGMEIPQLMDLKSKMSKDSKGAGKAVQGQEPKLQQGCQSVFRGSNMHSLENSKH